MEIEIDLENANRGDMVLPILGEALGYTKENYWGKNWDAFADILGYLNTGGIYGTNEIILMPVVLLIRNFQDFKHYAPNDFAILTDILNDRRKKNSDFDYQFF